MIAALLTSVAVLGVYLWQDGIIDCPDGRRYTSFRRQPYPFHRRWCAWPKWLLTSLSLASLVMLGALMGSWKGALMLLTLPGAWLCATRPTTVDAPAILLALTSSMLFPAHPYAAVLVAIVGGVIHERVPVFAAIYAWHPLLLVGLVGVQWWRKPAPPDADPRVGRGFVASLSSHRRDHDWLHWEQTVFAMRGLPLFAAWLGVTPAAWCALALSWAARVVCTDLGRLALWAAPLLIRDLPDVPAWMVLLQAVTFRRMA